MDKQKARSIREAAEKVLATLGEELNLQITIKGGTFDGGQITYKVEFAEIGEGGMVATKEAEDFKTYAHRYDMEPSDLGRTFTMRGETFTICGCKVRARKMPILATREDGNRFKFNHVDVKRALDAAA